MESIRNGIKTLLSAVTGIGNVWDHRRIIDDPENFDGVYVKTGKVNCWQFYNNDISEEGAALGGITDRPYYWTIEGWYEFTDNATLNLSSDYAFDALVELICNAFRDQYRLGGVTNEADVITNIHKDIVKQGSVRCHHVTMTLKVAKTGL